MNDTQEEISKDYIPCKIIKCIKYPACKNKTAIDCDLLRNFYDSNLIDLGTEGVWIMINAILPNLDLIMTPKQVTLKNKVSINKKYSSFRLKSPGTLNNSIKRKLKK